MFMCRTRRNENAVDGCMTNDPEEETSGSTGLTFQNRYCKYQLLYVHTFALFNFAMVSIVDNAH